jgi:hypothetical protein
MAQGRMHLLDTLCDKHGKSLKFVQILVAKPEGNNPIGILRGRWKYNIKMNERFHSCRSDEIVVHVIAPGYALSNG